MNKETKEKTKNWEKEFDKKFPLFPQPAFSGEIKNRWLKKKKELKKYKDFIRFEYYLRIVNSAPAKENY